MTFNPLEERGTPVEDQVRPWSEVNVQPYDKRTVHPYTRTRVIAMNGLEVEAAFFSHNFARNTDIPEVKRKLAEGRRADQFHQKMVNWLIPADEETIEVTLGYEQEAVDLTAFLARSEPDPYHRQVYEFALLEDFDHLYRYANLYQLMRGGRAEEICGDLTEIMPGRPTVQEHRHPADDVRRHWEKHTASPLTKLHSLTIIAAEQQTMNFYMTIGNRYQEPLARALYAEIAMIEEQHVTHYESMLDPAASWFENWVLHELNEAYMYWSFSLQETDPRIKGMWERFCQDEIGQLHVAIDCMKRYDGREPEEIGIAGPLAEPVVMEENKEYVRSVLAAQLDLNSLDTEFVFDFHSRYSTYNERVNAGFSPSEQVIEDARRDGGEYRLVTNGEHPNERLRPQAATV